MITRRWYVGRIRTSRLFGSQYLLPRWTAWFCTHDGWSFSWAVAQYSSTVVPTFILFAAVSTFILIVSVLIGASNSSHAWFFVSYSISSYTVVHIGSLSLLLHQLLRGQLLLLGSLDLLLLVVSRGHILSPQPMAETVVTW